MSIDLIVFDCDGTLFDTRQDIADAVNYARRHFDLRPLSLQEVTRMVGNGIAVLAQRAFADTSVAWEMARDEILVYYLAHPTSKAQLYPNVRETLSLLDRTCAVISNKPKPLVEKLLRKHRLEHYFSDVVGGETFERKKPDPMPLRYLMQKYKVEADRALVVGDHSPDTLMAQSAGVRSVYCRYGFFGRDAIGADFQIDEISELLGVLERIDS
jgi:phosphoglycolate phosphatase